MTYSCALFRVARETLEEAQEAKLELVCTKLRPDARASGCSTSAAAGVASRSTPRPEHGVNVPGSRCPSRRRACASERAAAAGLADLVEIRVGGLPRACRRAFDAIASIGMVEHVGGATSTPTRDSSPRLLRPGGRLLNHGIAQLRYGDPDAGPFSERFVFPDAAPLQLSRVLNALERAGLVTTHVEGFRQTTHAPYANGRATSTSTPSAPNRSSARSACASGGCTYAPRAAGSKPASPRSSRSSPTARWGAVKPTPPSHRREPSQWKHQRARRCRTAEPSTGQLPRRPLRPDGCKEGEQPPPQTDEPAAATASPSRSRADEPQADGVSNGLLSVESTSETSSIGIQVGI